MSEHQDLAELRGKVASVMPGIHADLEQLVRIPSVSFEGFSVPGL